jgi:hypothetical protein
MSVGYARYFPLQDSTIVAAGREAIVIDPAGPD